MSDLNATGSDGTIPEPVTTPTPDATTTGDPTGVETGKTFTQAEVNAMIAKEVKPLKSKLRDGDAATTKLAALEEAAKTEQEKAVEAARKEGAADKEVAITAARIEGRVLSAMARHGIPENLLGSVLADAGEIEEIDKAGAAVDALVLAQAGVYGVFAKPPQPATQGGAPTHVGTGEWDGVLTRSAIQDKINRAGGTLSREDMARMNKAVAEGRIVGEG